mmetsp:Transcript_23781/g.43679  ORF Transcript_23781/g.43679 Transcript_23781/m.43679 type:complete len:279 (-) Transcript_23781:180-1016(-)
MVICICLHLVSCARSIPSVLWLPYRSLWRCALHRAHRASLAQLLAFGRQCLLLLFDLSLVVRPDTPSPAPTVTLSFLWAFLTATAATAADMPCIGIRLHLIITHMRVLSRIKSSVSMHCFNIWLRTCGPSSYGGCLGSGSGQKSPSGQRQFARLTSSGLAHRLRALCGMLLCGCHSICLCLGSLQLCHGIVCSGICRSRLFSRSRFTFIIYLCSIWTATFPSSWRSLIITSITSTMCLIMSPSPPSFSPERWLLLGRAALLLCLLRSPSAIGFRPFSS